MAGTGLTHVWNLTNRGRGVARSVGLGDCSGSEPSEVSKDQGSLKEVQGWGAVEEWCPLGWGQRPSQPCKVLATGHILVTPYNLH